MDTVMDRETLDAFVDGALSPEDSARVVLHLADCPPDAGYVDALMETNALLAAAYADPLHQATPDRLRRAIFADAPPAQGRGGAGTGHRTGWRALRPSTRRGALAAALAASLAVAVGFSATVGRDAGPVQIAGADAADAALRVALETNPSGAVAGGPTSERVTLIATFFDGDGRPCREYEILDPTAGALTQGIACRTADAGWSTEVAVASRLLVPEDRSGAFVPAEGAEDGALDGALDRLDAGMLLTPDEERALIEGGWPAEP